MLRLRASAAQRRDLTQAIKYFRSVDWIRAWIDDGRYHAPGWFNSSKFLSGANRLLQVTLNTSTTIPHFVMLVAKDIMAPPVTETVMETAAIRPRPTEIDQPPELVMLVHFGGNDLDGWPGVTHGGINCTLLDHAMGNLISAHRMEEPEGDPGGALLTGNLNISFFSPIKTKGQQVIVKAWVTSRSRNKWTTLGQVVDEDDVVLTQGEGLFIIAGASKL